MKRLILTLSLVTVMTSHAAEPKIIYEEDPSLLITNIEVVATTGAADDAPEKAGLSAMLGELMLRGTKKKSRSKFQSDMERLGAALGVRTSPDNITFEGKVIKENTAAFIALLTECLLEPAMKETEFKSLLREQHDEVAHRKNNNGRLAGLTVRRQSFQDTPLERSVEGGLSTLAKLKLDDLKRAYNDRFHQGNVIFAVSSPFPEADIKKALTAAWQKLPDGLKKSRRSITPHTPNTPTLIVVNKAGTSTGSIIMAQPGITAQDDARFGLSLGNYSFGSEPLVSRLFKVIRGELGWTYAVGSTYHAMGGLSNQQGLFIISSTPSIEFSVKTIMKTLSMWNEYLQNGVKGEELALAKESLVNSYPFEFDSAEKRLGMKLHSFLYGVPILTPEQYTKKLAGISADEVQKLLKEKHTTKGWWIVIVADPKEVEKQLAVEQKDVPEAERLKIAKVIQPDQVIN